jgi:hypothetical protein
LRFSLPSTEKQSAAQNSFGDFIDLFGADICSAIELRSFFNSVKSDLLSRIALLVFPKINGTPFPVNFSY